MKVKLTEYDPTKKQTYSFRIYCQNCDDGFSGRKYYIEIPMGYTAWTYLIGKECRSCGCSKLEKHPNQ